MVSSQIRDILKESKQEIAEMKNNIKYIREQINESNVFKKEELQRLKERIEENPELFSTFKNTVFYTLKSACKKHITDESDKNDILNEQPDIIEINEYIDSIQQKINHLENNYQLQTKAYKKKIQNIQDLLKKNLNNLEKSVVKMTLREMRLDYNKTNKIHRKILNKDKTHLNKTKKNVLKDKQKRMGEIQKEIQKEIRENNKIEKKNARTEKKMRKALRQQEDMEDAISMADDSSLKQIVDKHTENLDNKLNELENRVLAETREKIISDWKKTKRKMEEKEKQEQERERLRAEKERLKEVERAEKQREKEREKQKKKEEKRK